jgi:photosystem II stability/assembly factor-like uncharacterized protein
MIRSSRTGTSLRALALASVPLLAPVARGGVPAPAKGPAVDPALLAGLEWRSIGPYRGGRVTAVAGVTSQPRVFYFGGTGGGAWKTTDGGISWQSVSDGQLGTGSVGAIAVAESDPNVIFLGMGEACLRGNISHGDGVYKSTDAGKTWKNVGLRDTRHIGRVRIHPSNPDLVYVAAVGHAFGPNLERGVFRSKDGGKAWEKVLFVDEKTGAIDLALDPTNPRILYAALYQVLRLPWGFESGGPGSGLYKSTDGGDSWTKITGEGLPKKGVWGRIGLAVSPANPSRVWAMIEAEDGGLYRSDDAGKTWRRTNEERKLRQRAWYYSHIFADPKNADSVYVLNTAFYRSNDGGKTFSGIPVPHGDNHDLWIAPDDPLRMIESNDGGASVSFDGGKSWSSEDNQPTAQFYHVITDRQFPYWVYGAQQDNTTVAIASRTSQGGIGRTDWYPVGGCESGYVAPDPRDPMVSYAGCYDGVIERYDHRTQQSRDVNVYPDNPMGHGAEGMKYRFQWTFPIVVSPNDPAVLYTAGNRVFRSTNEGQSWEAISPDLTRNDPTKLGPSGGPITKDNTTVEYYGTIFALAESRVEKGLLWAGSDDGLVHVSRDGGKTWSNVTPKEMPEWSMVSQIDPSPHDPGTVYLAVNRYKLDDYRPFVYATTDYGKTWRKITTGIPDNAFVRAVREDPMRKGLLFAGTEAGVYLSFDNGARWQPLRLDLGGEAEKGKAEEKKPGGALPIVPVTDLVVKDSDLVISTQGRSFWILDDVSPLRQMSAEIGSKDAHLFKPTLAYRFGSPPGRGRRAVGQNPPYGAIVYYNLKGEPKESEEVTLEFLDAGGTLIRKFSNKEEKKEEGAPAEDDEEFGQSRGPGKITAKPGLNRFAWDLRYPEPTRFKGLILWGGLPQGPTSVPGTYQVRLRVGGSALTESFEVRRDPRLSVSQEDLQRQFELLLKIRDKLTETHDAISRIRTVKEQVQATADRARGTADAKSIADAAAALRKELTEVEEELYQTKNQSSQDPLNFPIRLNNKLSLLARVVEDADARPTDQSSLVYDDLAGKTDVQLAKLKRMLGPNVVAFNQLVHDKNLPAVVVREGKEK